MNIDFSHIYGNEAVCTALAERIRSRQLSHAYLLAGPEGSGKKTLAFSAAAALCCESDTVRPCRSCPSCRKILSMQSPDLLTIGIEKPPVLPGFVPIKGDNGDGERPEDVSAAPKSIGVDAVRTLQADAFIMPNDLDYKLYIIGHADRMTVQAQNALLKLLEEPPSSVVFFLLCENPLALLPTVRSRVQLMKTEVFDDETLYELMLRYDKSAKTLAGHDPDRLKLFIRLSGGTIGSVKAYLSADAKTLAADAVYEAHETVRRCLGVVFAYESGSPAESPVLSGGQETVKPRKTALLDILNTRVETREQIRYFLHALAAALRDIYACGFLREDTAEPLFFTDAEQPHALAARTEAAQLIHTQRALSEIGGSLDINPNTALVRSRITELLMEIRYGCTDAAI
ncbi:MAG: ATP-binding protein [Eubacteriales bacterium]